MRSDWNNVRAHLAVPDTRPALVMVAGAAVVLTLVWPPLQGEGSGKVILRMCFWVVFGERTVQYPQPRAGKKERD